jgi:hypothetical protein
MIILTHLHSRVHVALPANNPKIIVVVFEVKPGNLLEDPL